MNQELTYTERAYTKLENLCYTRFKTMFIDDGIARKRMENELLAIKKQGSSPMYIFVYDLLTGIQAGSRHFCLRGVQGSSIVAYLLGLSEINPISIYPKLYSEFVIGKNGLGLASIEINVTKKMYAEIVNYLDHYIGEAKIRCQHTEKGKLVAVYVSATQKKLSYYHNEEEFRFGFNKVSSQKKLGKKIITGRVFDAANPKSFAEFVKCRGLSFGDVNGVWEGNAEELFKSGKVELKELIAHREDVYEFLLSHNINHEEAYKIAEDVTWGRIRKNGWNADDLALMYKAGIPEWFIKSCEKILYLFPRAHSIMLLKHCTKLCIDS